MSENLDEKTKFRLERGETVVETFDVPGSPVPRVVVRGIIEVAPAQVWKHIDQASSYTEFMPRTKEAVELSRDGDIIRSRVTIEMPFPLKNMTAITQARHTVEEGKRYERAWELVEGDYHTNQGSWVLVPYAGDANRTLVTYQVHAHPKMRIPKKIQALAQERSMPRIIEALRQRVS